MSDTDERIRELQAQVNILAAFAAQTIAMSVGEDPVRRDELDKMITHFEAIVSRPGSKALMAVIRQSADQMLSAARQTFPDDESEPG